MARTPRKSTATSASSAAGRVLKRRTASDEKPTTSTGAASGRTSTTRKAAAKKTSAAKAAAKKAPATKKAPAKKAPAAKKTPAKKTPAKKAAATKATRAPGAPPALRATAARAARLPVRAGEKAWTKDELGEVLDDLHQHAARIRESVSEHEEELSELMRDAGDGAGQDQADLGASSFERDQEMTVVNNEREMLEQIERALERIAEGTYGACESCGNPIGKGRLMAFPRASLCLTCKQREERR